LDLDVLALGFDGLEDGLERGSFGSIAVDIASSNFINKDGCLKKDIYISQFQVPGSMSSVYTYSQRC
jgi:hypothetical protein